MGWLAALFGVLALGGAVGLWSRHRRQARADYIDRYRFPPGIARKVAASYPHLSVAQLTRVEEGARQFFTVSLKARGRQVGMPSQAVDAFWHEFILHTRNYQQFCRQAFGRFLHHTPAAAMSNGATQKAAIRRAWWLACKEEGIDPKHPGRLPLLFALDSRLAIPNGFYYVPDCGSNKQSGSATTYCGSDLGCSSGACSSCSGGFFGGDAVSESGDGSVDSSSGDGCSSSGCSGSCGGGSD